MQVIRQNHRRNRIARKASRNTAMFFCSANNGLRPVVTTVKKNVPPGRKARRYCISVIPGIVGLRYANPTYKFPDLANVTADVDHFPIGHFATFDHANQAGAMNRATTRG
jgi:hypothetical protein